MRADNRLFVYGIFLDEHNRQAYGMSNPQYAVVRHFATFAAYGNIVEAYPVAEITGAALTGLLVDVDPREWDRIDALESAYNRVQIVTTNNQTAYMYVGR